MRARANQRRGVLAVLIALLLMAPAPAGAQGDPDLPEGPSTTAKVFDVAVLRPLGLVTTIIGAGLFPFAALVSAPGGRDSLQEAWEVFVAVPARNVYGRPLGEF